MSDYIELTAKDYDMTPDEVLRIKNSLAPGEDIYPALEAFIADRARKSAGDQYKGL